MLIGVQSRIIFNYFLDNCLIKVGDGRRIKFWHDKWCGAASVKHKFPNLITLSSAKFGSLHIFCAMKSSFNGWNFLYRRPLYAWELADEARLFDLLSPAPSLRLDCVDSLAWMAAAAGSGMFTVSSLYSFSSSLLGLQLVLSKFVWNHSLPPKVLFFGWLAWKNRIKSSEFLRNLGILGHNISTSCIFCNSAPESAQHLLLHCSFSWAIWSSMLQD